MSYEYDMASETQPVFGGNQLTADGSAAAAAVNSDSWIGMAITAYASIPAAKA